MDRLLLSPSCFVALLRATKTSAGFISLIGFRSQPIICHPTNIRFPSLPDASPNKFGADFFLRDSPDDNLGYLQSPLGLTLQRLNVADAEDEKQLVVLAHLDYKKR